jgi:hypothetical protein
VRVDRPNAHGIGTSVFAETIPPTDAYGTRTPPHPKQGIRVETIQLR